MLYSCIQQIFMTLLSRNFCLNSGSLLRFLSKQMQYPRKNVPHMPATIPAINLELIFKTVVEVENKNTLHRTRRKLLQIRSRCADCAAAQSKYLPSLLCAIVERQGIGGGSGGGVQCFGHPCDINLRSGPILAVLIHSL